MLERCLFYIRWSGKNSDKEAKQNLKEMRGQAILIIWEKSISGGRQEYVQQGLGTTRRPLWLGRGE